MKTLKFLSLAIGMVLILASCSKTDPEQYALEGNWKGTYTPNGGGTPNYFAMNFLSGGSLTLEANSTSSPDLATGSYTLVGDSVKGTFSYTIGIGLIYQFSGKYSANSNIINGTIGVSPSSNNNASFTVTKQ